MKLKTLLKILLSFKTFNLLGLELASVSFFGLKTICSILKCCIMPAKKKFLIIILLIIIIIIIIIIMIIREL